MTLRPSGDATLRQTDLSYSGTKHLQFLAQGSSLASFTRTFNTNTDYLNIVEESLFRIVKSKAEKLFSVGDFNLPKF